MADTEIQEKDNSAASVIAAQNNSIAALKREVAHLHANLSTELAKTKVLIDQRTQLMNTLTEVSTHNEMRSALIGKLEEEKNEAINEKLDSLRMAQKLSVAENDLTALRETFARVKEKQKSAERIAGRQASALSDIHKAVPWFIEEILDSPTKIRVLLDTMSREIAVRTHIVPIAIKFYQEFFITGLASRRIDFVSDLRSVIDRVSKEAEEELSEE